MGGASILGEMMNRYPMVTDYGMGHAPGRTWPDEEERAHLLSKDDEFCAAVAWITQNLETGQKFTAWSSYGLKHTMERSTGVYVSNGVFILAMMACGFDMQTFKGDPNVCFNVTNASVKEARRRSEGVTA